MADNSFPKEYRLLSAHDFKNLKSGSKTFKRYCSSFYFKKNELGYTRIGLSVSSKVGNSVKRNKIKRNLRESFRHFPGKSTLSYDFLVVVFPNKKDSLDDFVSSLKLSLDEFFRYISRS